MKRLFICGAALALLGACGGSDDGGEGGEEPLANPGFITPGTSDADWDQAITWAYSEDDGVFTDEGAADWSCLNTASSDVITTDTVTINGVINDFQTDKALPEAEVHIFTDVKNIGGTGVDNTVTDEDGNYTLSIAAGASRAAYRVTARGQMDTYSLNQVIRVEAGEQSEDISSVSLLTANALPAFIGVTRTPGLGVLAGTIRDCNNHEVAGAIVTVSDVSGSPEHLEGALSYYFSAEPNNSLPVRHNLAANTNVDGRFSVLELQPGQSAYLQLWGFLEGQDPESDDLTLLAEIQSPILPDSVVISDMEPIRQ
ncbi:MAG: carboxypeptidase-like regulatory domain-containing protein [Deltaproteobacteria bacterium]|nr:carboxypeptidase-like regulatory domain-containing protein [Deltaproteobacteria bacterium]